MSGDDVGDSYPIDYGRDIRKREQKLNQGLHGWYEIPIGMTLTGAGLISMTYSISLGVGLICGGTGIFADGIRRIYKNWF